MLTGMFEANNGRATVFGESITNMDEIRKFLGVCP